MVGWESGLSPVGTQCEGGKACENPKGRKQSMGCLVGGGGFWEDQGRWAWAFARPPRTAPTFEAPHDPLNNLGIPLTIHWGGQGLTGP